MQLYVGNLNFKANERDIEDFFRKHSPAGINLKAGFAFVGFDSEQDAKDALHDMNGEELLGMPVRLEIARGDGPRGPNAGRRDDHYDHDRPRRYDDFDRSRRHDDYDRPRRYDDDYDRPRRYDDRHNDDRYWAERRTRSREMYGEPRQTPYRLIVKNLSTRCSWQDLKDMMRSCGEVTYADAHRDERNTGFVCFERHEDLRRAMEKYQKHEVNGRAMELIDDTSPASSDRDGSPMRGIKRRREESVGSRASSRSPRSPLQRRRREEDYKREDSGEERHRRKRSRERGPEKEGERQ